VKWREEFVGMEWSMTKARRYGCGSRQPIHEYQFRNHWCGKKIYFCVNKTWKSHTKCAERCASVIPEYQHNFHWPGRAGWRQYAGLGGAEGGWEDGRNSFLKCCCAPHTLYINSTRMHMHLIDTCISYWYPHLVTSPLGDGVAQLV
jgi:hypothetical protein